MYENIKITGAKIPRRLKVWYAQTVTLIRLALPSLPKTYSCIGRGSVAFYKITVDATIYHAIHHLIFHFFFSTLPKVYINISGRKKKNAYIFIQHVYQPTNIYL